MLILASASPRRCELLKSHGWVFKVSPAKREKVPDLSRPAEYTMASAYFKALEVAEFYPEDVVLGVDTAVFFGGKIIGKPKDSGDAANTLRALSQNTHEVYTGFALISKSGAVRGYEKTAVTFRRLSESEILSYVKTGSPLDKAGSYGAQDEGAGFIEKLNGSRENVIGLPVERIELALSVLGFCR
ncbi:MAG: Maf family protein [Eubacteriales bacterium]